MGMDGQISLSRICSLTYPGAISPRIAFPSWPEYQRSVADGYHHQATRNTLQLNLGPFPDGQIRFSEVSRIAGLESTDWSWGGLIADFDLDGQRDIFVPNGIFKDLLDQDFISRASNADSLRSLFLTHEQPILKLLEPGTLARPLKPYVCR